MRRCVLALWLVVLLSSGLWSQSDQQAKPDAGNASSEDAKSPDAEPKKDAVAPESTQLELIEGKKAVYPLGASEEKIQGTVWLHLLISETGDVEKVEVVSGDPALTSAAVDAAKTWKFKPYIRDGKPVEVSLRTPIDFALAGKVIKDGVSEDGTATAPLPKSLAPTSGASSQSGAASRANPASAPAAGDVSQHATRVRISQGVSQGLLVHQVAPVYPTLARMNHVQGSVVMRAVIGKDGRIHDLQVISGPSDLVAAARGAVEQWRYRPYLLLGEPVEVETQITVNFTLR